MQSFLAKSVFYYLANQVELSIAICNTKSPLLQLSCCCIDFRIRVQLYCHEYPKAKALFLPKKWDKNQGQSSLGKWMVNSPYWPISKYRYILYVAVSTSTTECKNQLLHINSYNSFILFNLFLTFVKTSQQNNWIQIIFQVSLGSYIQNTYLLLFFLKHNI